MRLESLRFLIRDRDSRQDRPAVSADERTLCEGLRDTAARGPRPPLLWSERHALRVLSTYAGHDNGHRPHQAREQLLPLADHHTAPLTDLKTPRRLFQTRVLGGLINEYRYAA